MIEIEPVLAEASYPYNIEIWVMMTQEFDRDALLNRLPSWYAPIERYPSFYSTDFVYDLNYTINYSFRNFTTTEILEFRDFIYNNSVQDLPPLYMGDMASVARYVPSDMVEEYLVSLGMDKPTIVFIDTFTPDPSGFEYYYYNASSVDLEGYSNPRPYGATYQTSGGGHKAPLLWYDFSAGPTSYRGDDFPHISQMNDTELLDAMVHHLQRAIELRFLPSWIYSPIYSYNTVTLDYVLIDLSNGSYDFLSKLNTDYIIQQYSQLIPMANWTTRIREYNYTQDQNLLNILIQDRNDTSHRYYSWNIVNYLKTLKYSLFNDSTKEDLIIPIFLFTFPDDWLFDSFLGLANNEGANFSFVISAANERWSDPQPDFESMIQNTISLNGGQWTAISNQYGYTNEIVQTILTSDLPLNIYLLDPFEFAKYANGSTFTPLAAYSGVSSVNFNFSAHVYQDYYWVFENPNLNPVNLTYEITTFEDRSFGLTFVTMHEMGHAFGLSHPHDGFSWIDFNNTGNGEFLDWLWDMSYSQMTYAHHYREISIMDKFTYFRGILPKMMKDFERRYNILKDSILNQTRWIPDQMYFDMMDVQGILWNMTLAFTNWMEKNVPGYLQDIPYGKPADFFPAFEFLMQRMEELESYDLEIHLPVFVENGNPEDYWIKLENEDTGTIYYDGLLSEIDTLNTTYAMILATVTLIKNGTVAVFLFLTWDITELRIDLASIFAEPSPSTEDRFPTGYTSNSTIMTRSDTSTEDPFFSSTPRITLPMPVMLMLSLPIIVILRKKSNNQKIG
ncbi:MAG: hypothetical protein D6732_26185 [Methanobacteriota archaeon]|nr:MAG: hypothetical protein D6732_26185 [Euryarchaeota archaeon]